MINPDADWYVDQYWCGFWIVRSRSGRKSGAECRYAQCTLFTTRRDADEAVVFLNARDTKPIQLTLQLEETNQ